MSISIMSKNIKKLVCELQNNPDTIYYMFLCGITSLAIICAAGHLTNKGHDIDDLITHNQQPCFDCSTRSWHLPQLLSAPVEGICHI